MLDVSAPDWLDPCEACPPCAPSCKGESTKSVYVLHPFRMVTTNFTSDLRALGEGAVWVAARLTAVRGSVCSAMGSMTTLCTQLGSKLTALLKGTVRITVSIVAPASRSRLDKSQFLYTSVHVLGSAYVVVGRAVRSMTALGSDLFPLVFWQVRKVGRIGRSHC